MIHFSFRTQQYDFYRDSNIGEAVKVRPVLTGLMVRIEELLAEWPEHPTLGEVLRFCTDILSYQLVESSVARKGNLMIRLV